MKLKIILPTIIVSVAILIQLIPYGKDHTNPKVQSIPKWNSQKTKELFSRACADCHSHNTKWPWYSNVAPISWLVTHDVKEGREHFNISMINKQKKNKIDDTPEEIEENEMPPAIYILNHPEAKLSNDEKQSLINGLKKTFNLKD